MSRQLVIICFWKKLTVNVNVNIKFTKKSKSKLHQNISIKNSNNNKKEDNEQVNTWNYLNQIPLSSCLLQPGFPLLGGWGAEHSLYILKNSKTKGVTGFTQWGYWGVFPITTYKFTKSPHWNVDPPHREALQLEFCTRFCKNDFSKQALSSRRRRFLTLWEYFSSNTVENWTSI